MEQLQLAVPTLFGRGLAGSITALLSATYLATCLSSSNTQQNMLESFAD